ncbi:hypothetical protein [Nocardioides sp. LHG3406-4]
MGCAVGTVKSQVSAGLAKLRRQLEATGAGDDVDVELLPLELMVVNP